MEVLGAETGELDNRLDTGDPLNGPLAPFGVTHTISCRQFGCLDGRPRP